MPILSPKRLRAATVFLDFVLFSLALIWFLGGIPWHDRTILRHGPDLRRVMLGVAGLAALAWPELRARSIWLRMGFGFWRWLETRRGRWAALGVGCLLACVIGVLQALALRYTMYDVGLYHQVFWAVSQGHGFLSTISGAGNYLLDHLSVSYALFAPLFSLTGGSPLVLPVLQPLLIFSGVAAWVWLAERLPSRWPETLAAAATLFGLTFDSLWGNLRWGFHDTSIYFAAMSWAFALLWRFRVGASSELDVLGGGERVSDRAGLHARAGAHLFDETDQGRSSEALLNTSRTPAWMVPVVLALICVAAGSKEIELLDAGMFAGVWAFFEWKRGRRGWALGLVGFALSLFAVFVWFEKLQHPADKNYFNRYYSYLGNDLGTFLRVLFLSPSKIVEAVGAGALIGYGLTVFLPWLFQPLAWSRRRAWPWLLVILPSLASAALSTDVSLRGRAFHYVLELWPILAVLTLAALARRESARWPIAWAMLALLAWSHDPIGNLREYGSQAAHASEVRARFAEVPSGDSVIADEQSGTWLANRLEVTRWASLIPWEGRCPQWAVLVGPDAEERMRQLCGAQGRWDIVWRAGEWVGLRRAVSGGAQ